MRILVTGANGLLGQKLIQLLAAQKEVKVIASSRGVTRLQDIEVPYHPLDVTIKKDVLVLFKEIVPDTVIHTAAMTQVDDCELNQEDCKVANIEAVRNIVDGCREIGAHLIHLSTDFIFDGSEGPLTEEAQPSPVNFYGETKLEAEKIIINSGIKWAMARTVLVYGIVPGLSRSNIILWVKENLENHKTINVVNDQWRTPTLAEDLAQGCWLIAKNSAIGIFNISGKDMLTPYDMALKVADYFHLDNKYIVKANSSNFSQPAKRPAKTGFVIDKAIRALAYNPHSFEEGIEIIANQVEQ